MGLEQNRKSDAPEFFHWYASHTASRSAGVAYRQGPDGTQAALHYYPRWRLRPVLENTVNHLLAMFGDLLTMASPEGLICRHLRGTDMHLTAIETSKATGLAQGITDLALARALAEAASGDGSACFDLGVSFSTGSNGAPCDLIEAHKWFNLAAAYGHEDATNCRADIAGEMTAREIAEAQRRAREFLATERRRAA